MPLAYSTINNSQTKMFVLIPRSHTYTATEVLPLQGNTLWLKPGLPQRQHFTSSKTYQEDSLAMPTQSYKCSLSPRESWLQRGFVLRFSSETQGPEETHLLLCPGPWQSPENFSYISQHTGMALTPQNYFAHNIKRKCHFFFPHRFCHNNFPEAYFLAPYIFSCKEPVLNWSTRNVSWNTYFENISAGWLLFKNVNKDYLGIFITWGIL